AAVPSPNRPLRNSQPRGESGFTTRLTTKGTMRSSESRSKPTTTTGLKRGPYQDRTRTIWLPSVSIRLRVRQREAKGSTSSPTRGKSRLGPPTTFAIGTRWTRLKGEGSSRSRSDELKQALRVG